MIEALFLFALGGLSDDPDPTAGLVARIALAADLCSGVIDFQAGMIDGAIPCRLCRAPLSCEPLADSSGGTCSTQAGCQARLNAMCALKGDGCASLPANVIPQENGGSLCISDGCTGGGATCRGVPFVLCGAPPAATLR